MLNNMLAVVIPDLCVFHAPYSDRSGSDLSEGHASLGKYGSAELLSYLRPVFSE